MLEIVKQLLSGFGLNMLLFFTTLAGGIPLGLVVMFGYRTRVKPVAWLFKLLVWIIRGTPLMLQLMAVYFLPSLLFGHTFSREMAAVIAFIVNYACYFAEIYRGGIQSVPKGQQEAGQVLGMTKSQIFFKVTLLQMIKRILPPISNEIITLVKDTSLARVVALQEIIWMGEEFLKGSRGIAGAIWPLFFTGAYYLVFSGILTALLNRAERRLDFFKA